MTRPNKITGHSFDPDAGACSCGWHTAVKTTRARREANRQHIDAVWSKLLKSTAQEHVLLVARAAQGWSQQRLAEELSTEMGYKKAEAYGQESIARWESPDPARRVPADVVKPLARVLKISPLALVGGDPEAWTAPPEAIEHYGEVLFALVRQTGLALKIINEDGDGWELLPRKRAKS